MTSRPVCLNALIFLSTVGRSALFAAKTIGLDFNLRILQKLKISSCVHETAFLLYRPVSSRAFAMNPA